MKNQNPHHNPLERRTSKFARKLVSLPGNVMTSGKCAASLSFFSAKSCCHKVIKVLFSVLCFHVVLLFLNFVIFILYDHINVNKCHAYTYSV